MAQRKRGRETFDECAAGGKDHLACDQCRIKKVRCGKERPQCSNCTRVGTECDWSGNGKKPNQTVWLSQSITGLGDRLNQLQNVVENVHTLVQRLDPAPLPSPPNTIETSPLDWPVSEAVGRVPQLLPVLGKLADTAHSHVVLRGPDDSERCFGPTSLWWLSSNFGELLRESVCRAGLDEHGIVTQDAFSLANEKMRQLLRNEESAGPRPPRDGSSLTSPPHVILEALMDPYFDTINPYFPIWTKKRFQHLVQRSKEGLDAAHERGFAVCANNLVILTLTAKVLQSRAGNQPAGATSQMGSSTDSDLLKTFVRSAHRAFSNVEQLLRPTLINIQALLSLCLVAQQHLGEEYCSLALKLAGQVASAMGLHRLGGAPGVRLNEEGLHERQNVLHCLTILDRATCWCQGSASKLSACEAAVLPAAGELTGHGGKPPWARFALTRIQDRIYSSLYSQDALGLVAGAGGVAKETITGLLQELEQWRLAHGVCLDLDPRSPPAGEDADAARLAAGLQAELALLYFQTRTRILWPLGRHDGASRMLAEDAWSCLHLFGRLWTWTSEQGHYAGLSRHVLSFSPMAVFHLAAKLITEQQQDGAQLRKFDDFACSLQVISSCAEADSYMTAFSAFVQVLLGLLTDVSRSRQEGSHDWKGENDHPGCSDGPHCRSVIAQGGRPPSPSPVAIGLPEGHQQPADEDLDFMAWLSDCHTAFDRPGLGGYFEAPCLSGGGTGKMTLEDLWQEYLN